MHPSHILGFPIMSMVAPAMVVSKLHGPLRRLPGRWALDVTMNRLLVSISPPFRRLRAVASSAHKCFEQHGTWAIVLDEDDCCVLQALVNSPVGYSFITQAHTGLHLSAGDFAAMPWPEFDTYEKPTFLCAVKWLRLLEMYGLGGTREFRVLEQTVSVMMAQALFSRPDRPRIESRGDQDVLWWLRYLRLPAGGDVETFSQWAETALAADGDIARELELVGRLAVFQALRQEPGA